MSAPLIRLATDPGIARRTGFWWGLAEGSFFFIVPDVYISFATLFSLRAGAIAWGASIAGSLVATALLSVVVVGLGWDYPAFLVRLPGISPELLTRVGDSLSQDGLPYTALLVVGGVPLKVYTGLAFSQGFSVASVLLWTLFARLVRIAPAFAGFALINLLARQRIYARPRAWTVALGVGWVIFYSYYFVRMSRV